MNSPMYFKYVELFYILNAHFGFFQEVSRKVVFLNESSARFQAYIFFQILAGNHLVLG